MTSYQIPEPKSMNANAAIRWMLNHNGGQYPALIKTNRGVILKKQHDATGSAEYIGVNHTGHWMTATRAVSLIADGVAEPVNAVIVETQQNTEVNAQ